jgi:hypothetical protein
MFWLKFITNFIKILREGQTPAQVAGGFALDLVPISVYLRCSHSEGCLCG